MKQHLNGDPCGDPTGESREEYRNDIMCPGHDDLFAKVSGLLHAKLQKTAKQIRYIWTLRSLCAFA